MKLIIKHYLFNSYLLYAIGVGLAIAFVMAVLLFDSPDILPTVISSTILFPYLEIFSRTFSKGDIFRNPDETLPLSFTSIWLGKIISYYTILAIPILGYVSYLMVSGDDFWQMINKLGLSLMIMSTLFFIMGKWFFLKSKNVKVLLICLAYVGAFVLYLINFHGILEALQNMTGLERHHPIIISTYLIPLISVNLCDLAIEYLYRKN